MLSETIIMNEVKCRESPTICAALISNLVTRWCHLHQLQIQSPDGACCISSKFGHLMSPLTLVPNLVTRWRHLIQFQIWSPDDSTCISSKFGHLCNISQNLIWLMTLQFLKVYQKLYFRHQITILSFIGKIFPKTQAKYYKNLLRNSFVISKIITEKFQFCVEIFTPAKYVSGLIPIYNCKAWSD